MVQGGEEDEYYAGILDMLELVEMAVEKEVYAAI
jgi:hypothetical protein